jgi:hypothetical protein
MIGGGKQRDKRKQKKAGTESRTESRGNQGTECAGINRHVVGDERALWEETGQPELSDFFSKEESTATPDATHAGQLPPFAELAGAEE